MTETEAISYLLDRGDAYGLSLNEVKQMIPSSIRGDVIKCAEFAEMRDLSHDLAQSTHPELANDPSNIMFENSSVNRARGAEEMTDYEELMATLDNELLAARMNLDLIPDFVPVIGSL
jgi:hypothetical protein